MLTLLPGSVVFVGEKNQFLTITRWEVVSMGVESSFL